MTSQDINNLVRERAQLQSTLRQIRTVANDSKLDDAQKVQAIRAMISGVQGL